MKNSLFYLSLSLVLILGFFSSCQKQPLSDLDTNLTESQIDSNKQEWKFASSRSTCSGITSRRAFPNSCCYLFNISAAADSEWTLETGDGTIINNSGNQRITHCYPYSKDFYTVKFYCNGTLQQVYTNPGCIKIPRPDPPRGPIRNPEI